MKKEKSTPSSTTASSPLSLLSGESPIILTGETIMKRLDTFSFLPFRESIGWSDLEEGWSCIDEPLFFFPKFCFQHHYDLLSRPLETTDVV